MGLEDPKQSKRQLNRNTIRLVDIKSTQSVNPYFVSSITRSPKGQGCMITMIGESKVIKSDYSYEHTCKLLATDQELGDSYEKWEPHNESVEIEK